MHTLRTGLSRHTIGAWNGVFKENGKVGRVRGDPFYLLGDRGSVGRSVGRSIGALFVSRM